MYTVIFDLDGTISDPATGITRSINYALEKLGYQTRPEQALLKYIGPPLDKIFKELTGTDDEAVISQSVNLYRERYIPVGYKENQLYQGMDTALSELAEMGCHICLATTKRKDIAEKVLTFLKLDHLFSQVHGCDMNLTKVDLLKTILSDKTLSCDPLIMIGDRYIDFLAATEVKMPSLAVQWGYGNESEFKLATALVKLPSELPQAVKEFARPVKEIGRKK